MYGGCVGAMGFRRKRVTSGLGGGSLRARRRGLADGKLGNLLPELDNMEDDKERWYRYRENLKHDSKAQAGFVFLFFSLEAHLICVYRFSHSN